MSPKFNLGIAVLLGGLVSLSLVANANDHQIRQQAGALLSPMPETVPGAEADTPAKIALGEKLYFDKRLSINDSQSCNSCHNVATGGVDNLPFSPGAEGQLGGRNSPTVYNAAYHFAQFWDGRAADLAEQAKGPILNPVEMGMPSEAAVIEKLSGLDDYPAQFASVFGGEDPLSYDNLAEAIAAFERTLVTVDRFDAYLSGDDGALNAQEKQGLQTFMAKGCVACHNGPLLGGHIYQKMGLVKPYANQKDQGRFDLTGNEADRMMFKVPSLRNIALTAPYFHDGGAATLDEAVSQMARLQSGLELSEQEVADIVQFLNALTMQPEERVAKAP